MQPILSTQLHRAIDGINSFSSALYTVEQFSLRQPAFTEQALRNMIFKANPRQSSRGEISGNGLIECGAIIRLGRKILIDEIKFLQWIRAQSVKEHRQ